MSYYHRLLSLLSLFVTIFWGSFASAAFEYRYVFGSNNYSVLPGHMVLVDVYLQETVNDGSTPWFTTPGVGLFSGGVRINFDQAPIPTDRAEVLSTSNILKNPLFTDTVPSLSLVSGSSAGLSASVANPMTDLIQGTTVNSSSSRILLGSFNFTAGLVNNEVTHLLASDFNTMLNENLVINSSFDPIELDASILPATATITVIPEPSSILLLGLSGVALAGWQVRRLRRRQI